MTTIHRSPTSPMLGGTLFVLAVWLTSWLASGCVEIDCDDATALPPVVINPPPPQPEQPQPPIEPELWCGLETTFAETETPVFREDWTSGRPFEVGGGIGYAEVFNFVGWTGLRVHYFGEDGDARVYYLSTVQLDQFYTSCSHNVDDVVVDGSRVHVLFSRACWPGVNPSFGDSLVMLSTIDVEHNLYGGNALWSLDQDAYNNYQLALDGEDLVVGAYNVFSAQLIARRLGRQGGFHVVRDEQIVRGNDPEWGFTRFVSFTAVDGLLTYQLADDDGVQTTRYRACD